MLRRSYAPFLLVALLAVAVAAFACKGGDDLQRVTVDADSTLEEPDLLIEVRGDFVSPDSNAFTARFEFPGFGFEEDVVVVGEDAWTKSGEEWEEASFDDPDFVDKLELALGREEFWSDFDLADFDGFEGTPEIVNGIEAQRISLSADNLNQLARLFDANEDDLEGVEEFTIWLAEDGGWPVAMRASFVGSEDLFDGSEEQSEQTNEEVAEAPSTLPSDLFDSFHYGFVIAAKSEEGGGEETMRMQMVMAISRVDDEALVVEAP